MDKEEIKEDLCKIIDIAYQVGINPMKAMAFISFETMVSYIASELGGDKTMLFFKELEKAGLTVTSTTEEDLDYYRKRINENAAKINEHKKKIEDERL